MGSDSSPGCPGLAGSANGGDQGGFGRTCLLVGGGNPAQDVELRPFGSGQAGGFLTPTKQNPIQNRAHRDANTSSVDQG